MTIERHEFLDQWFGPMCQGDDGASGIIGDVFGRGSPGTAYVRCTITWADSTAPFARGIRERTEDGAISKQGSRRRRAKAGASRSSHEAGRRGADSRQRGDATGVVLTNGDELSADMVLRERRHDPTFLKFIDAAHICPAISRGRAAIKVRGSSGKVNLGSTRGPTHV